MMILNADARAIPLRDGSVHCVVTSPPYWGLRDYGTATWVGGEAGCDHRSPTMRTGRNEDRAKLAGSEATNQAQLLLAHRTGCGKCGAVKLDAQLGLERTPEEYVAALVAVFREVWRVLRDDGTCWLNLGDSYATRWSSVQDEGRAGFVEGADRTRRGPAPAGLKSKDLVGVPWRVAFALQADGWYLRSDVIWSKPNPMPESITDRPTKAHEYLFLLAKRERYYYDAEAIKDASLLHDGRVITYDGTQKTCAVGDAVNDRRTTIGASGPRSMTVAPTRNRRSVWEIATQAYPEAHFATFPEALVEPCILAGTSERGACAACGAPWGRVVERHGGDAEAAARPKQTRGMKSSTSTLSLSGNGSSEWAARGTVHATTGWQPTCPCTAPTTQPLVLDPFAGSGTVGLVCHRLGRRFVGLELKPDYCRMAAKRTAQLGLM